MDICLRWYDLSTSRDFRDFSESENQWLHILQEAYGRHCHSPEVHLQRVQEQGHILLLVSQKSRGEMRIIATSYIRSDGKRAATAVLRSASGRGIGRMIVAETSLRFPKQHAEVREGNSRQRRNLEKNGFRPVSDVSTLSKRLGPLEHLSALRTFRPDDPSYVRVSAADPSRIHRYVMYERT